MNVRLEKSTFWLLGAILFLVPLIFWRGVFFPHVFTKTVAFQILVEFALALWVPLIIWQKEYRPRLTPVALTAITWVAVLFLTAFTGENLAKSIWSDFERMMGVWLQLHLLLFFLMLASVVRTRRAWDTLLGLASGVAVAVAFYGIVESFFTAGRISATLGNSSFLATYLLMGVWLVGLQIADAIASYQRGGFVYALILWGVAAVLLLTALVLASSRGAVVGLVGGVVVFVAYLIFLTRGKVEAVSTGMRKVRLAAIILLILGVIGAAGAFLARERLQTILPHEVGRLFLLDIGDRTTQGRLLAWRVAWQGWQEHLWLGWGPENFNLLFDRHYDPRLYEQEPWFDRAHNFVFDVGGTSGILGLATYLSIFSAALFALYQGVKASKIPPLEASVLAGAFGAYLVQNLFTFDVFSSLLMLYLLLAYTDWFSLSKEQAITGALSKNIYRSGAVVFMSLAAMVCVHIFNIRPFLASAAGHAGWEILRTGGDERQAMSAFDRALAYDTSGNIILRRFATDYVFEYFKQQSGEVGNIIKRSDDSLKNLFEYARTELEKNIAEEPKNVKWPMYAGQLANLWVASFDSTYAADAERYFLQAREMSPGRPQIYIDLAQARRAQGNVLGLWEALDEGLVILPDYVFLHINTATHAIDLEDAARERQQVAWLLEHDVAYDILRDTYFKKQRYIDALRFQELYLGQALKDEKGTSPEEVATRYAHLAALELYVGNKTKAREAALNVLKYDASPKRKSEVEAFLKLLGSKK